MKAVKPRGLCVRLPQFCRHRCYSESKRKLWQEGHSKLYTVKLGVCINECLQYGNQLFLKDHSKSHFSFVDNLKKPACPSKRDALVLSTLRYSFFLYDVDLIVNDQRGNSDSFIINFKLLRTFKGLNMSLKGRYICEIVNSLLSSEQICISFFDYLSLKAKSNKADAKLFSSAVSQLFYR